MAHVGIEGLTAGHGKEGAADHDKGQGAGVPEIGDRRKGTERCENGGAPHNSRDAEHAGRNEPDQHDRTEYAADPGRAIALDEKQHGEDDNRQGNDGMLHLRRIYLQPLDRAQYGNRRSDRPVAVKQGRPDQADDDQSGAPFVGLCAARADERQQREDAALAVIVGAHDEDRVFDRDDDDQRPEDQRHDAEHGFRRHLPGRTGGFGGDVEGIERARADVAEHHPHARERRRR